MKTISLNILAGKLITPNIPNAVEARHFVTNGTSFAAPFATAVAANVIAAAEGKKDFFFINGCFRAVLSNSLKRMYCYE